MSPFAISFVAFACVASGVLLAAWGHSLLPEVHRGSDTKEVVRLGMALVGTTVALVLGLLIASAKNFYDTQNAEVTEIAANLVLLDRILSHYGPESKDARQMLRSSLIHELDTKGYQAESDHSANETLFDKIQELSPQNDSQRLLHNQAITLTIKLAQTRWLMFEQKTSSVPMPLLVMLVFWLTLLFTSFGLFVRPNATAVSSLMISALAVCGAIFLILEMYQPESGLIHSTDAPLRAALAQLGK